MRYAEIAINTPVDNTFHYHIPPELDARLNVGHLVRVGFRTAMQPGIVVALHDTLPTLADGKEIVTKPVIELLDPEPVVNARQLALAHWLSERYISPLGTCLWLMLPPGMTGNSDSHITLNQHSAKSDDPLQQKIIDILRGRKTKSIQGKMLERSIKDRRVKNALNALKSQGIVDVQAILRPPRVRPKKIQVAGLAIADHRIADHKRHLGKNSREAEALTYIIEEGIATATTLLEQPNIGKGTLDHLVDAGYVTVHDDDTLTTPITYDTLDDTILTLRRGEIDLHILNLLAREGTAIDVSWIYAQTGAQLADLKRLETLNLVTLGEQQTIRDSLADLVYVPAVPPRLSPAQREAWHTIREAMQSAESGTSIFLLHGVTGSGKTEIYLRAINHALAQGKQAIFLVPEIALTAQTVRRVIARFPGRVAILHSALSDGERFDTWRRARAGEIDIIVGARSALFTPLPDIGVVILDEEHDNSYKQSPPVMPPYYHTRDVAEYLMRENGGTLILGSATPDVGTYYRATRGDMTYLHLPERIMGHRKTISEQSAQAGVTTRYEGDTEDDTDAVHIGLPPVEVVDMREELKAGNISIFSAAMQTALRETLQRGEQAILYLNRRGASTYVFCRDCGYTVVCPRCDTPMTYHEHGGTMRCHHCGYTGKHPTTCPECGSARIKFFGAGTQQIEAAFKAIFPNVVSLRWDADTAQKWDEHDLILQRFSKGDVQVLIGTQMIAKGLDLPLVTLVGVVSADMGINLPDYGAGERVFQLLTQVSGRAGRGLLGGKVILQTYQPENYAIHAASTHDYVGFYQKEIDYRRELGYPPFRRLVRILFTSEREVKAINEAENAATLIKQRLQDLDLVATEMIGPVPCFYSRVNRLYRWQIIMRGIDPARALTYADFGRGWYVDIDPVDIL
ncbi:MAG: primosomal protein N' [Aggregatilineales bacterium]